MGCLPRLTSHPLARAIAAEGAIATLTRPRGSVFELRVKTPAGAPPAAFAERLISEGIECHDEEGDLLRVVLPPGRDVQVIFALAAAAGAQVRHLKPSTPTLDDVFAMAVGEH